MTERTGFPKNAFRRRDAVQCERDGEQVAANDAVICKRHDSPQSGDFPTAQAALASVIGDWDGIPDSPADLIVVKSTYRSYR